MRTELRIDHILDDLESLLTGSVEGAERTRDIVDGLKRFSAADRDENIEFNLAETIERSVHWVTRATPTNFRVHIELPHIDAFHLQRSAAEKRFSPSTISRVRSAPSTEPSSRGCRSSRI